LYNVPVDAHVHPVMETHELPSNSASPIWIFIVDVSVVVGLMIRIFFCVILLIVDAEVRLAQIRRSVGILQARLITVVGDVYSVPINVTVANIAIGVRVDEPLVPLDQGQPRVLQGVPVGHIHTTTLQGALSLRAAVPAYDSTSL